MDSVITTGIYAIAFIVALGWGSMKIALTPERTPENETEEC